MTWHTSHNHTREAIPYHLRCDSRRRSMNSMGDPWQCKTSNSFTKASRSKWSSELKSSCGGNRVKLGQTVDGIKIKPALDGASRAFYRASLLMIFIESLAWWVGVACLLLWLTKIEMNMSKWQPNSNSWNNFITPKYSETVCMKQIKTTAKEWDCHKRSANSRPFWSRFPISKPAR